PAGAPLQPAGAAPLALRARLVPRRAGGPALPRLGPRLPRGLSRDVPFGRAGLLPGPGLSDAPPRGRRGPGGVALRPAAPPGDARLCGRARPLWGDDGAPLGAAPAARDAAPLLAGDRHVAAAHRDPPAGAAAAAHGRPLRLAGDGGGGGAGLPVA